MMLSQKTDTTQAKGTLAGQPMEVSPSHRKADRSGQPRRRFYGAARMRRLIGGGVTEPIHRAAGAFTVALACRAHSQRIAPERVFLEQSPPSPPPEFLAMSLYFQLPPVRPDQSRAAQLASFDPLRS